MGEVMCCVEAKSPNPNTEIETFNRKNDEEEVINAKSGFNPHIEINETEKEISWKNYDTENKINEKIKKLQELIDLNIIEQGGSFMTIESLFSTIPLQIQQIYSKIDRTFLKKQNYDSYQTYIKRPPVLLNDGSIYYGQWDLNGNRVGNCGIFKDGNYYEGYNENSIIKGKGILIDSNGGFYIGDLVNNKPNGDGYYEQIDGTNYSGEWLEGAQHGKGVETNIINKYVYTGDFQNGRKSGKGVLQLQENSNYNGEFLNNSIHGEGVYSWGDGRKYIGTWKFNKMHGNGIFTWGDGRRYEGQYKDDIKEGFGKYFWSEDTYYEGEFLNGKRHGKGTLYSKGKVTKAQWINGKIVEDKEIIRKLNSSLGKEIAVSQI